MKLYIAALFMLLAFLAGQRTLAASPPSANLDLGSDGTLSVADMLIYRNQGFAGFPDYSTTVFKPTNPWLYWTMTRSNTIRGAKPFAWQAEISGDMLQGDNFSAIVLEGADQAPPQKPFYRLNMQRKGTEMLPNFAIVWSDLNVPQNGGHLTPEFMVFIPEWRTMQFKQKIQMYAELEWMSGLTLGKGARFESVYSLPPTTNQDVGRLVVLIGSPDRLYVALMVAGGSVAWREIGTF